MEIRNPRDEFETNLFRDRILADLTWQTIAISVSETPNEQGRYSISASKRIADEDYNWSTMLDGIVISGQVWVENRYGRPLVCWSFPKQRGIQFAQDNEAPGAPLVDWTAE